MQDCSLHAALGFGTGLLLFALQQLSAILLC